MWTRNRLDLQTLGSQPVTPKNLLDHCSTTARNTRKEASQECHDLLRGYNSRPRSMDVWNHLMRQDLEILMTSNEFMSKPRLSPSPYRLKKSVHTAAALERKLSRCAKCKDYFLLLSSPSNCRLPKAQDEVRRTPHQDRRARSLQMWLVKGVLLLHVHALNTKIKPGVN